MALQSGGQMSFGDVYNEITGESLTNPLISITAAELGLLQNAQGQTIPLNQFSPFKPDGSLPTIFPTEWYQYCQVCNVPKPFLTITKSAPGQAFNNQNFSFTITVTNNGQSATFGNIFVTDILQTNLVFQSISGTNWTAQPNGQSIGCTFSGVLQIGQSTTLTIVVKTFYNTTYNNQASVSGGSDIATRFSNTTSTQVITQSWTSTQTVRADRTFQKNNCGDYGTGSYEQIFSPFFTNTYTSFISQADADSNAYQISFGQASSWLDNNGQNQANIQGTCVFQYPVVQLTMSATSSLSNNSNGQITINITNQIVQTTGRLSVVITLPVGLSYLDLVFLPPNWGVTVNGQQVTLYTPFSLAVNYNQNLIFNFRANTQGTYTFNATANGGQIQNNFAASNNVTVQVVAPPIYSFGVRAENFSYSLGNVANLRDVAVPTDEAYYTGVLTISNGHTGSDGLRIVCYLPAFFDGNFASVSLDTNYFESSYNVLDNNSIYITNKVFNVPVGQYFFRIKLNMPIDYFRAFANSQDQTTVTISSNGQTIPRNQPSTFYFYINNAYRAQGQPTIQWANNYVQGYSFNFTQTPTTTSNMVLQYRHSYQGNPTFVSLNSTGQGLSFIAIWHLNPTRDNRLVEASYSPQEIISGEQYFGMYTVLTLLYNNQSILFANNRNSYDSTGNTGIKINSRFNEPKVRPITLTIQVNSSGNYINAI